MQINEVISLSDKQLNEQLRITNIRDNLQSNINEYFIDLRLSTLLLEADEDLIGRSVAWLARSGDGVNGEIIGIGSGAQEGKIQVRGGSRNSVFYINPDKLLDPRTRTPLGITLGATTAPVTPAVDDNDDDLRRARRTGFVGGLKEQRGKGWMRQGVKKWWMWSLAGALGLTVEWGTGDAEGADPENGIGQDFGDEVLDSWFRLGNAGRLIHWSATKPGATSKSDLSPQELVQHMQANEAKYERMVEIAYGAVASMYFVAIATALFGPAWTITKGTYRVVRKPGVALRKSWGAIKKFIKYLRSVRTAFTAASTAAGALFGAGVGGIVTGLMSFILGSAAIWAVELVLKKTGAADALLEMLVYKFLEWDLAMADSILPWTPGDVLVGAGRGMDQMINSVADGADIDANSDLNAIRDVQNQILTNPNTDSETADAMQALAEPGGASSTTTTPAATVAPGASNGSTAGAPTNSGVSATSGRDYGL
jgi:hypothetical protein